MPVSLSERFYYLLHLLRSLCKLAPDPFLKQTEQAVGIEPEHVAPRGIGIVRGLHVGMKRHEYVYIITSLYRKAIDSYLKYKEVKFMDIENINWFNKIYSFLKAKFKGDKYGKSF